MLACVADAVDLVLYGHPHPSEIYDRAIYDLRVAKRRLVGDVDVDVRVTVRNLSCMVPALRAQQAVEQVLKAAVKCGTIESHRAVLSVHFRRPVVDGLDCLYVSFRPSTDRLLLI